MSVDSGYKTIVVCHSGRESVAEIIDSKIHESTPIMECRLSELENAIEENLNPVVVFYWPNLSAEVGLVTEFCSKKLVPLIVVSSIDKVININILSSLEGAVIYPQCSETLSSQWLEYACLARVEYQQQTIEQLQTKIDQRKAVEKAKGLLMTKHHLTEEEAYVSLRSAAMQSSQTLQSVAQRVVRELAS